TVHHGRQFSRRHRRTEAGRSPLSAREALDGMACRGACFVHATRFRVRVPCPKLWFSWRDVGCRHFATAPRRSHPPVTAEWVRLDPPGAETTTTPVTPRTGVVLSRPVLSQRSDLQVTAHPPLP